MDRALAVVEGLKPGTWQSVEVLAMLAIEAWGRPEAARLYASAVQASQTLASGSWESARALAWLARAGRELGLAAEEPR